MNIAMLRRNRELSGLTFLLSFMQKFCWGEKKNWVPCSAESFKGKEKKSKTRMGMEKGAEYLSRAELGEGLIPSKTEQSIAAIKNWKYWFVQNMMEKENRQLAAACDERITRAIARGKNVRCEHKGDHRLGRAGASALADSLFRMYLDNEIRALDIPAMDPYFTRDPGPVEFGHSMSEEEYLPRQFAEAPTGEFYLQSEDEHAISWKMSEVEYYLSDDEVSEDVEITPIRTDWEERNSTYFDLRQLLLHGKFTGEKVLAKARMFAHTDVISWWQFKKLREFAGMVANYRGKKRRQLVQEEMQFSTSEEVLINQ